MALKTPFKINVIDEEENDFEKKEKKNKHFEDKDKTKKDNHPLKSEKDTKNDKKEEKIFNKKNNFVKKALDLSESISSAQEDIDVDLEQEDSSIVEMKKQLKIKKESFSDIKRVSKIDKVEDKKLKQDVYTIKGNSVKDVIAEELNNEKDLDDFREFDSDFKEQEEDNLEISQKHNRSIKIYKRIAFTFVFLTFCLVLVMLYFTFVRITVVIIPNQEKISSNMIFDVYDKDTEKGEANNIIKGIVEKININHSQDYEATGENVLGKDVSGMVKIINNSDKSQPLVATTRLLPVNDQDKLFRIRKTVNVPAQGSAEVEIYADEPSPEMSIEATKFIIPGLWAGLQDKIYAQSSETIEYKKKTEKFVEEDDILETKVDLEKKLIEKAKEEVDYSYGNYGKVIYEVDKNSIETKIDANKGDKVDKFKAEMNADVIVVAFYEEEAIELAQAKFVSSLDSKKEMVSFNKDNIIYTLNKYDMEGGIATVNVTFEGKASINQTANIVDKEKLIGLNKDQIDAYLKNLEDVAGYEIKFYPPFIKSIPKLIEASKIKVEIKN